MSPRMIQTRSILLVLGISSFGVVEVFSASSSSKLPEKVSVRVRVKVTVQENYQELDFPGTSGFGKILFAIPKTPAVLW